MKSNDEIEEILANWNPDDGLTADEDDLNELHKRKKEIILMANRDCKHGRLSRVCEICELEEEVQELKVKLTICKNSHQILLETIVNQKLELDRLRDGREQKPESSNRLRMDSGGSQK